MRTLALILSATLIVAGCAPLPDPNVSGSLSGVVKTRFIPIAIKFNFTTRQFEISIDQSVDIGFLTFSVEAAATTNPPAAPPAKTANAVSKLIVSIGGQTKTYDLDPTASYIVHIPNDLSGQSTVSVHDGLIEVNIPNPSTTRFVDENDLDAERAKAEIATAEAQTLQKRLDKKSEELEQTKRENTPYPEEKVEPPKDEVVEERRPEEDPGYQAEMYPELPGDTSREPGGTPLSRRQ